MNQEPTVLDYVKALLTPWQGAPPAIPPAPGKVAQPSDGEESETTPLGLGESPVSILVEARISTVEALPLPRRPALSLPWRTLVALGLGIIAQRSFEPHPDRDWRFGVALYILAAGFVIWAALRNEWVPAEFLEEHPSIPPLKINPFILVIGLILAAAAFLTFTDNLFSKVNLTLWFLSIFFLLWTFWQFEYRPVIRIWTTARQSLASFRRSFWNISVTRWTLLLCGLAALVIFFRVSQLNQIAPEMTSDHAEKLMDVQDVLDGQTHIFFPRNTGREALQFYMTAAVIKLFHTGLSFTSLKIGTIVAGLILVIFVYLLGVEVDNRQVGFWAAAFAGVAYWPNVIARIALRFTLYPLFVAITFYFLIRAFRRLSRNDFILAGIFLGIGLHGYTPIRILPLVVLVAFGFYLIHKQSKGVRQDILILLTLLVLFAVILFLPLLRYAQQNPEAFAFRAFSRLWDWERPLPGPIGQIFLYNLGRAMAMFAWDNGEVWSVSIPYRPALDVISAVLFYLGMVLLAVRYVRRRHWLDIFMIASVPMLLLPSILSLAFPAENPVLNRTGGALVPVFVIVGMAMEGILAAFQKVSASPAGTRLAWVVAIFLFAMATFQNYDLVFRQYEQQYELSSLNTSEMDRVISDFIHDNGNNESSWIIPFSYWVDTRLVGLSSGYPMKDYAIPPDQLASTQDNPRAKLFLLNTQDQPSLSMLQQIYPTGWAQIYKSKYQNQNKDFLMFFAPARK